MEMMEKYHLGIFPSFPFFKWSTFNKVVCKAELKKRKKANGVIAFEFSWFEFFLNYLE
jgi:hypothetical protein